MWLSAFLKPLRQVRQFFGALAMTEVDPVPNPPLAKEPKLDRRFDFKRYAKRHALFMVSYYGWNYRGLVRQPDVEPTIETAFFEAMLRTKLIESIETANFRRCGRTDKGVSAFRQVFSMDVRSLTKEGVGVFLPEGYSPCAGVLKQSKPGDDVESLEMDYLGMLNRVLPNDIRVLAWAPAPIDYSARFDCSQRTYKYFFPKSDLNIEAMIAAGQRLIGLHDFRNFCKLDLDKNKIKTTMRNVLSFSIEAANPGCSGTDPYAMYVLTITGKAFLWHQIRNIVTILVLIGQGKEEQDVITKLLDIETYPRRPQYSPALETPLILYDCQYENVKWRWDDLSRRLLISRMQKQWIELEAKAQMIKSMSEDLASEAILENPNFRLVNDQVEALMPEKYRKYTPLLKRRTADSCEDRRAKREAKTAKKEMEEGQRRASDTSDSG